MLNQLMDSKLLDGFVSHTEGLCMKTPLERSLRGFTFVDTAGFDFPIEGSWSNLRELLYQTFREPARGLLASAFFVYF